MSKLVHVDRHEKNKLALHNIQSIQLGMITDGEIIKLKWTQNNII